MLTWIRITISAEIELVECLYGIFYEYGYLYSTMKSLYSKQDHDWFEMMTYIPDNEDAEARKGKLEQALWHLQAFDLVAMDPPQYDQVPASELAPDEKNDGIYWVTDTIGIKISYETETREADYRIVVTLKPGTAFGSGYHPSTRLSIRAMEQFLKPHMSVLDVGTGTGILAFIAAQTGCLDITAIDIDKASVEHARENAVLNHSPHLELAHASIGDVTNTFDFVVANLPASILSLQCQYIVHAVKAGGTIVLSGMTRTQAEEVKKQYEARSLEKIGEIRDNDWIAYIFQKIETDTNGMHQRGNNG